ncbi:translation initiation factor IF-2 subunit beta [Candidatus Woesearchaeota archaeon]|nr:translation initiation factor IF-2 subunit beta [Candidatus Woesearchaeota archaeon]
MELDYEGMLKKARKELPESVFNIERFEVPKVTGHLQGNKTVISNFHQIADTLGRTPEHLLKYVLKELATPGQLTRNQLLLGAKVPASRINEKIRKYATEFVLCPACGKPDTKIIKEGELNFLRCNACGSKHSVKMVKDSMSS